MSKRRLCSRCGRNIRARTVAKEVVMDYTTDYRLPAKLTDGNLYRELVADLGGFSNAEEWKAELERGPDIFLVPDGERRGEIFVELAVDDELTYRTLEQGDLDQTDSVARSVASGIAADVQKMFSDQGLDVDRGSIQVL